MIYLIYLILAPVSLFFTLIALLTAPLMVLFAVQKDGWLDNHSIWGIGPRLPACLNLFMTPDNSLDGDASFQAINGRSYWAKVKWLWRNPAYSFALRYINTVENKPVLFGNDNIKDNDNAVAGWCFVKCAGLFQFTWVKPIGFNRCIYCVFGWNIRGTLHQYEAVKYQATFAFSPRISGFK
jgi:hypothetical protein